MHNLKTVVLLAAGNGKRMNVLTEDRGKAAIQIFGKTLLEHMLFNVKLAGFNNAICVIKKQDEKFFSNIKIKGLKHKFVFQNTKRYGTAHALSLVKDLVPDFFSVIAVDSVFDAQELKNLRKKASKNPDNYIILKPAHKIKNLEQFGTCEVSKTKLTKFYEKQKKHGTHVNTSIYFMKKSIFEKIKKVKTSKRGEYEITDVLPGFKFFELKEKWDDLSNPSKILDNLDFFFDLCLKYFLKNKKNSMKIKKTKTGYLITEKGSKIINSNINGNLIMLKNSYIVSSHIQGNVFLDEESKVGPFSFIRGTTYLGKKCEIGDSVTIKASLISNNTKAKHLTYIGDSIVGENCNFGSATQISNYRFDANSITLDKRKTNRNKLGAIIGNNVKFGVLSCTMPGVIIHSNCWIGPQAIVKKDLKKDSYIHVSKKMEVDKIV